MTSLKASSSKRRKKRGAAAPRFFAFNCCLLYTSEEYDGALSWMELCGLTGYWQDFSSATTEYLPDFGDKGLLCSD